ncbi:MULTISPECIES: type II toxin-antitoxin system Phd/YefM family antitoxin [unclassified Mesorhizobium]|uniref:type II toxin-antitoxin system Phd/YefM family antitoxin n=1 Tax=unclassified Mesorhizobium TaxID=325217 RepID=UPI00112B3DF8|nr:MULTISPECIES: type II toxin-antitoxin system Phd/YefM family antitoxin [unclassified Mesorhizobium]TPJ50183.1 type II toxin-antitoxin system Phd/YefM family antitoxin [Mesorhizobium sp. B2-6-6]MBZ9893039.1 type II toxin-antitoxin system Phd/YefM family antitoxin [Mesorhizobium sp. BR1-1-6]MBZ9981613.1 type II toxin-antitoxin system Phd/YefM family antitoxin [Mesorhizobium sp. BR-1-1-8]MCA0001812.1 type II toxin-antitoxin system Phd/YefM family antitoxin [Mesorhizobium sp. B264B2A]MCA0007919
MSWQLRDARNNLSKLVRQSREKGPQTITVRGQPSAVVLAVEDYERWVGAKPSLAQYLLSVLVWDDEFVEEVNRRPNTMIRAVHL